MPEHRRVLRRPNGAVAEGIEVADVDRCRSRVWRVLKVPPLDVVRGAAGYSWVLVRLDGSVAIVVELTGGRFFIATLFLPQVAALEGEPSPLTDSYVSAAAGSRPGV